jgi:5-methylcytosine-specific restriction endonuclease McrA
MALEDPTLVLNRSWMPIGFSTVRIALTRAFATRALFILPDDLTVHELGSWLRMEGIPGRDIRTPTRWVKKPEVILMQTTHRRTRIVPACTRRGILDRDRWTCQYCADRPGRGHLSVDHILPRSKGGVTSWDNCVAACTRCNQRKGDRTLEQSGLGLIGRPLSPFLPGMPGRIPDSWVKFLPMRSAASSG